MGRGFFVVIGIAIVIAIVIMSNTASVSYDNTELEQKIVDDFNVIRAEKGLSPLTVSNKYYETLRQNSEYNANHPTHRRGQDPSEWYVKVPNLSNSWANVMAYGFLRDLDGNLESDAEKIVKDFMSDLYEGVNAKYNPDGASVHTISISCVIKDGWIGTTFTLY